MRDSSLRPFHAVRFFESTSALVEIVAAFISDGLALGQPGLVFAKHEHAALLESQLQARGIDVEELKARDELIIIDAARHLSQFMVDGMPVGALFRATTIPIIERACRDRANCVIRAYGEMVDVLWQAGHTVAATKLEMLWNELAASHEFGLLCGYSMGQFYKDAEVQDIYHRHTHVLSAIGELIPKL